MFASKAPKSYRKPVGLEWWRHFLLELRPRRLGRFWRLCPFATLAKTRPRSDGKTLKRQMSILGYTIDGWFQRHPLRQGLRLDARRVCVAIVIDSCGWRFPLISPSVSLTVILFWEAAGGAWLRPFSWALVLFAAARCHLNSHFFPLYKASRALQGSRRLRS